MVKTLFKCFRMGVLDSLEMELAVVCSIGGKI